jgi:hypothetical protein
VKVHSIISNTISEETLHSGHLSIRFLRDGFKILLEDVNFQPVILNRFYEETGISLKGQINTCEDWLRRHTLMDDFNGEVSIIPESSPATFIPESLFNAKEAFLYLEPMVNLKPHETVRHKNIRKKPLVLVYAVTGLIVSLTEKFSGTTRIIPAAEAMLSMAEQINASDHQRGFMAIETQPGSLNILMIREDQLILSNQISLKQPGEMVYHTLNAMLQLGFDRKKRPLYIAGIVAKEEIVSLKKYIRHVTPMPYHIIDLDKPSIQEHVLLAEATRCG